MKTKKRTTLPYQTSIFDSPLPTYHCLLIFIHNNNFDIDEKPITITVRTKSIEPKMDKGRVTRIICYGIHTIHYDMVHRQIDKSQREPIMIPHLKIQYPFDVILPKRYKARYFLKLITHQKVFCVKPIE